MLEQHDFGDLPAVPSTDPWSGWARLVAVPGSVEYEVDGDEAAGDGQGGDARAAEEGLAAAVTQLTAALSDERDRRSQAEDALRAAQAAAQMSALEATRLGTELAAERTHVTRLERDRDEVIRRAEELLTAVRERADQRLSAELDAARRQWNDLLAEERRRVEVLDGERAALLKRLEDAWLAGAVLRRSRPLRPWSPSADVEGEGHGDPVDEVAAPREGESPELAAEIGRLRQRLRAQLHKPAEMPAVEAGVDRLREARLAREAEGKRHRSKH